MAMKYKDISLKLPTDYDAEMLRREIGKALGIRDFSYQIEQKSLDARKKQDIHWAVRVGVLSEELQGDDPVQPSALFIPYRKRAGKAVVIGSGPAGFFAAYVLQKGGIQTTLIERGAKVKKRAEGLQTFERGGVFSPTANYAFGEGGAGTFSDGKLTSRSKHISDERRFILSSYVQSGAPEEIEYMTHPHLGSDHLKMIVRNQRKAFEDLGGTILFETMLEDLTVAGGRVAAAVTGPGSMDADWFVVASGNAAHDTWRMLMNRGVGFRSKNFAIGCRVEHPQELINRAQWGRASLPGVKAAEYRLTSTGGGILPVYTFCMCPGGTVVPAMAYEQRNVVNGMSQYRRDGKFANAGCVAGVSPDKLAGREVTPVEALEWVEKLEAEFYRHAEGYRAPYCRIQDFINRKETSQIVESSYPLGLTPAPLWALLPARIADALREGLKEFDRKVKGFASGSMMGLESKTSAPVMVLRDKSGRCSGFENLYVVGEGSGQAGGIISSAADGIKAAMHILQGDGG